MSLGHKCSLRSLSEFCDIVYHGHAQKNLQLLVVQKRLQHTCVCANYFDSIHQHSAAAAAAERRGESFITDHYSQQLD